MSENFEPNVVAFLCNWCSYAGADLAGTSRIEYPSNLNVIRVMCSGRVNPMFVVNALQQGADGVLVSGCHPGDCHYMEGNFLARRRVALMRELLNFVGVDERRFNMSWVSASEGAKWRDVVKGVVDNLHEVGAFTEFPRKKIDW
ncbi:MAG: hydrogenase iron-sulfur subunit [Dethiobacter sp.]|jgi:coenzyme F420-reducing hydrogenase delta subunit|nr:hydrogenase iron-sulfur subunit [Dethiobacter sp.]MBS3899209.1 hydrogenase iron-sulfur subunit [Dethiobacter sp.]MCL4462575.1 hydrogenase iron-sulfur subunit [Bacillota bacterium]